MRRAKILASLGVLLIFSLACNLFLQAPAPTLPSAQTPTFPPLLPSDTLVPPTVPLASTPATATAAETPTSIPPTPSEPPEIYATYTAVAQAQSQLQAPVLESPSYSEQIDELRNFAWGLDNSFWVATDSTLYADPNAPIDTGDWINEAVYVSPDGSIVASLNNQESAVRFYDVASGAEQRTLRWYEHAGPVLYGAVFSADWSTMAWFIRATVQIMNPWNGEPGPRLYHEQFLETVVLSPDGSRVATYQGGGPLIVWDTQTGDKLARLEPPTPAFQVAISPDLGTAALVDEANAIVVWDIASAQPLYVFAGRGEQTTRMTFSPDGGMLAAAFDDETIQTWDLETGAELESLGGYTGRIIKLRFSPYDPTLAGQTLEGVIWLWRTEW